MISRHSMVSFLTSNKLYLLAVVYSKANEKELDALTAAIKLETGVDISRDDYYNIKLEDLERVREFEGKRHGFLNALISNSIYNDDKRKAEIKTLNFKFIIASIGIVFALIWFTLFMFISVPPENAKFIDAGIGLLSSLVGCFVYGYFKSDKK